MDIKEFVSNIKRRDNYVCKFCQDIAESVVFITPLSCGGKMEDSNAVLVCDKCRMKLELGYIYVNIPINYDVFNGLISVSCKVGRSISDIIKQLISEYIIFRDLKLSNFNGKDKRVKIKINKEIYLKFLAKCNSYKVKDVISSIVDDYINKII